MGIVSIVVGFDGSEPSDHALCFAIGLARRERARVSTCFVARPPIIVYPVGLVPINYEAHARELEKRFNEELERADVGGRFYHRSGDVVVELKRLAHELAADIIVVGRPRHPHLHIGSVPRRLLDTSRHAVLIVP